MKGWPTAAPHQEDGAAKQNMSASLWLETPALGLPLLGSPPRAGGLPAPGDAAQAGGVCSAPTDDTLVGRLLPFQMF